MKKLFYHNWKFVEFKESFIRIFKTLAFSKIAYFSQLTDLPKRIMNEI